MTGRGGPLQRAVAGASIMHLPLLLVVVLVVVSAPQQVWGLGSSKVACDYSNRLCQWNASYAFGAAVLGDLAFFHGGLYSNDATTPVNGSHMEVMDLRTLSPYLIQVESNPLLNTTRYNHFLAAWRDQLLAVAGQVDDANGKSVKVMNVLALDLNSRTWRAIKNFTTPRGGKGIEYVFDAVAVSGDFLLAAFQVIDVADPRREYLALDLNTAAIEYNYPLFKGVLMLDWPLIAIMSLTSDGSHPHLVLHAKREMPAANKDTINWFVIDDSRTSDPLPFTASSKLARRPGGTGGRVLSLNILQIDGKPKLVMLAATTAVFGSSSVPQNVTAVSVFDLQVKGTTSVALQLDHLLLMPPLAHQLADLRSADLPLLGSVAVPGGGAVLLPYVGRVEQVGTLDSGNADIQQAPGGFIIKGSGMADQSCQPGATWQPFVIKATFPHDSPPSVVAVSNYTWCATRSQQTTASRIVSDAVATRSNSKVFRASSREGVQLMLLNAQTRVVAGGLFTLPDEKAPLMGAFINLNRSSVANFTITPPEGYIFPEGLASCMGALQGTPVYVEAGGSRFIAADGAGQDEMSAGLFIMDAGVTSRQHSLLRVSGSDAVPARTQAALACAPDGRVFLFGGLLPASQVGGQEGGAGDTQWQPSNALHTFKLGGRVARPSLTQLGEVTGGSAGAPLPPPRSGHAMVFLPPGVVSGLGMPGGALLVYGGSNITTTNLEAFAATDNDTETALKLSGTSWDRSTWLWDLGASKWVRLATEGAAPPGLMYHSMEAYGEQVVVFGGQALDTHSKAGPRVSLSTDLYVLDFSSSPPFWRRAAIRLNNQGAFQLDWPNSGVALLPEFGAVALKHRAGVNLAPIPQSLDFSGSGPAILQRWGLDTLNTTAGDWLRLAPGQPRLDLQQPLLLAADVILTGVTPGGGSSGRTGPGRHLLQQPGRLELACGTKDKQQQGTAVSIRSGGAQLSNLVISGCRGRAVDVGVDATGAYTAPAVLTNITLTSNRGSQGAALYVGPAAAVTLQGVTVSGNTAPQGVVYAAERSSLTLSGCSISANNGSAVVFAGSSLNISSSSFSNNTAAGAEATATAAAAGGSDRTQDAGGALRLLCKQPGPGGYDTVAAISNSSFRGNRGVNGGAGYAGAGTTVRLVGVVFSGNRGYDGGGLFADRDACLASMVDTSFANNTATQRGGALKMHNPACDAVSWVGGRFSGNVAGDGGALFITEVTTRTINASGVYEHNRATRQPVYRQTGSSAGGSGGAVYLGLWGSRVLLHNSTFTNNSAAQFGGALHALAIDSSSITLDRVNASQNTAALDAPESSEDEVIAATLRSEGGVLHVYGSVASVSITNSTLDNNLAGRGGAVSMNSEQGRLVISSSSFTDNAALTAGGAVSVTERKSVAITGSTFRGNALFWRDLAAGGAVYCFLCSTVNLTSCHFEGNRAAYGGGVALLQPWQPSVITNTSFVSNVALPTPWEDLDQPSNRRRRRGRALLGVAGGHRLFSGSRAVMPAHMGGQEAAVAILGPIAANVTGDSGYYTGGGGLYVSLSSGGVRLEECVFLANSAFNGGGFLARTDACRPAPTPAAAGAQPAAAVVCQLQLSRVSVRNNTASAAGGALITNIRPEVVQLEGCSAGTALTRPTLPCLEAPNSLLKTLTSSSSGGSDSTSSHSNSSGRSLLQAGGAAASSTELGVGGPNAALSGYGPLLLTAAASVQCLMRVPGGEQSTWLQDDCAAPIAAPPGQPFGRSFVLLDGLGDPITTGIWDARMPMGASAEHHNASAVPFRIFGNTTVAQNGTAAFTGLVVNGKPGDTVTLTFRTQNGLNVTRQVILRRCSPGEITDNSTSSPNEASYTCRPCPAPQFSFYPTATSCSQCALLPPGSFDVCNMAALVPADGWYQSHPRSPVLSRCISSLACRRSQGTRTDMAVWANAAADTPTALMTPAQVAAYMEGMCSHGYTGPLCGSCLLGYGHSGYTCVKCLPVSLNSFAYFLVCAFMLVVPAVQMVLHAKGVNKSTQLLAEASKLSGSSSTAPGPYLQSTASHSAASGGGAPFTPVLSPVQEGPGSGGGSSSDGPSFVCPSAAAAAGVVPTYVSPSAAAAAAAAAAATTTAAGAAGADSSNLSKDPTAAEAATMQQRSAAPAAAARTTDGGASKADDVAPFRADQGPSSDALLSPFSELSAVAGAMAVTRDGSAASTVAPVLPGMHPSQALGYSGSGMNSGSRSASLFARLFDTGSVDHEDSLWGVGYGSSQRRVLYHTPSSITRRGPSGTSTASAGSVLSFTHPGGPPVESIHGAAGPDGLPATFQQPDSFTRQSQYAVLQPAAARGGAYAVVPRPSVHRRTYKFWHADIISMLVNYMQLLGLLRLVRINWAEQLTALLTYLDFTSGAATWVSVECSLTDDGAVPRSVMRSIIVLLWPLGALICLGIFWSAAAFSLRHRAWARRPQYFRRWLTQHVVMCVVILLYFLYTTTTREIISLFSCQQVDNPAQLPPEAYGGLERVPSNPVYQEALTTLRYRSASWLEGVWTSDTRLRCGSGTHIALVVALGVPGVLAFSLGLPVALWVYLARINRQTTPDGCSRLEDPEVELQFGSVYEKYRYGCYYWECLILLEAFALTLLLVLLMAQNNAALQVLVAMAVIFVEAVLHITFQPYACRLLDTLRRLAVYGLMSTLFLLMLVALSERDAHDQLLAACMVLVALVNIGVIGVHVWACSREVMRWLRWSAGKGPGERLTWADVKRALLQDAGAGGQRRRGAAGGGWCFGQSGRQRWWGKGAARGGGEGEEAGKPGPPAETARGDQVEQGPDREGVVVVVNPQPQVPAPEPTAGWLGSVPPSQNGGSVQQ